MDRHARLTELASAAGLGEVRHIHRERRPVAVVGLGLGVVGAPIAALCCGVANSVVALSVVVLAIGGAVLYVYGAPIDGGRRWIAVCRNGLVIDPAYGEAIIVPWGAMLIGRNVQLSWSRSEYQVAYLNATGTAQVLWLGAFQGNWSLLRSIKGRTPTRASRVPAIVGWVAVVAILGLLVWRLVLPKYLTHQVDALPESMGELSVACHTPGTAFRAAPAFAGPAPHPVAVYYGDQQLTNLDPAASVQWQPEDPHSVQLIACVSQVDKIAGTGPTCSYSSTGLVGLGGGTETVLVSEARYRIDLYELRSHRKLASTTVIGADDSCPQSKFAGQGIESHLSIQQYHDVLGHFVGG